MFDTNLKLSLCRTCLATLSQPDSYNIFSTFDLAKKLILCSGLPVESTDEYPENVCIKCYEQILLFYEFQQMCCTSMDTFHELLENNESLKEAGFKTLIHPDNQAEDPLTEDQQLKQLTGEKSIGPSQNTTVLNEFCQKKKRCKGPKTELEYTAIERNSVIKNSSESTMVEIVDGSSLNYEIKGKTDTNSKEILGTEMSCAYKGSFNNQFYKVSPTNGLKVLDLSKENKYNKNEETEEKKCPSDTESCCSTQVLKSTEKQNHQRDYCGKRLKSVTRLPARIRQHNGLPPYRCSFEGCERSFHRLYYYNKHQKEHKLIQQEGFKCDIDNCERSYKSKSNLNIHKRKFHNLGPQLKIHMCEICGKVFRSSAVLNDHRYTHIDRTQFPYACEEKGCTKRFSNKEKLKVHKMRHAGIKNFICPHCGMRKTTRNELKAHINYHTLEKTWPCKFCSKVFNSAGNLKMHVKNIHEGAKDFACRYCERTFAKADTKKYHEMTHTGEKPHECKDCGRRFVQPAALRTHRKIHLRKMVKLAE